MEAPPWSRAGGEDVARRDHRPHGLFRFLTWFTKRTQEVGDPCPWCDGVALQVCPVCEGAWRSRRCHHCLLGHVCPVHGRTWLV